MRLSSSLLALLAAGAGACNNVDHAKMADTAAEADTARVADTAKKADEADKATQALDATTLAGKPAAAFALAADAAKKLVAVTADAPIKVDAEDPTSPKLTLARAGADTDGYLAKGDFLSFAAKQDALTPQGPLAIDEAGKLTIGAASPTSDGVLSAADYLAFASKQNALAPQGPLALDPTGHLSVATASATTDGALAKADFAAFASKQNALVAQGPLALDQAGHLAIATASATTDGALAKADFAAFAAKQGAISAQGPLALDSTNKLTVAKAATNADGYLAQADWNAFNGKQPALVANGPFTLDTTKTKLSLAATAPLAATGASVTLNTSAPLALDAANKLTVGLVAPLALDATGKVSLTLASPLVVSNNALSAPTAASGRTGFLTGTDWDAFNTKASKTGEAGYIQNAPASPQTASLNIVGNAAIQGNVTVTTGKFTGDGSGLTAVQAGTTAANDGSGQTGGNLQISIGTGQFANSDGAAFQISGRAYQDASNGSVFSYTVIVTGTAGISVNGGQVVNVGTGAAITITRPSAGVLQLNGAASTNFKRVRVIQLY